MNFLAHYYFDNKPENPYFNLGLIFPDIVRNFVRGSKLNLTIKIEETGAQADLLDGCIQHVQSDKIFHAWDGFHSSMDFVTQSIRNSEHDIDKDWFIAHILVELTMDYFLLNRNEKLANKLYTDLAKVDTSEVLSFLQRHDFSNFDSYQSGFDRFMRVRYLESYTELDNIVYALGRICTKMKLKPFTDLQKHLIKEIVVQLNLKMPELVAELKDELK